MCLSNKDMVNMSIECNNDNSNDDVDKNNDNNKYFDWMGGFVQ